MLARVKHASTPHSAEGRILASQYSNTQQLVYGNKYSGTSLMQTPPGQKEVSFISEASHFGSRKGCKSDILGVGKGALFRDVFSFQGVSL